MWADLEALDALLGRAVTAAHAAFGVGPGEDPHRGLHISAEEVDRLLERLPGEGLLVHSGTIGPGGSAWARLREAFGLDAFDVDVALIALAPEVDLRYERLYAYLQDDVTRRRPSVELCLNLLCSSRAEKLERLRRFMDSAPLARVATLVDDPNLVEPPLAARSIVLDPRVVAFLLGSDALDSRLASCARLQARPAPAVDGLPPVEHGALQVREGAGREVCSLAAGLARRLDARLLTVDLSRALDEDPELTRVPALIGREAALSDAVVCLEGTVAVAPARRLRAHLAHCRALVFGGDDALRAGLAPDALVVELPPPTVAENRAAWSEALDGAVNGAALDALAGGFQLTPTQMRAAARHASLRSPAPEAADLLQAARAVSAADLGPLVRKLRVRRGLSDIVLPDDRRLQLRELIDAIRHRALVYGDWGFGARLSSGSGVSVLFAGPSGTGKTLAAEVIASELGLDLYRIDLSAVVSKYIGDTEKNLARVFAAGERGNGILFFDEADALFGRRSEVRDAHDRYANIEVGYLLQRIEEFSGVAILASNLRKNMDEAFVRRLQFTLDFPFPGARDRQRIWASVWPAELPRAEDVDVGLLAERFELSGGSIRNVALSASFYAAADGRVVTMGHVLRATRRELQKMGKVLSQADLS